MTAGFAEHPRIRITPPPDVPPPDDVCCAVPPPGSIQSTNDTVSGAAAFGSTHLSVRATAGRRAACVIDDDSFDEEELPPLERTESRLPSLEHMLEDPWLQNDLLAKSSCEHQAFRDAILRGGSLEGEIAAVLELVERSASDPAYRNNVVQDVTMLDSLVLLLTQHLTAARNCAASQSVGVLTEDTGAAVTGAVGTLHLALVVATLKLLRNLIPSSEAAAAHLQKHRLIDVMVTNLPLFTSLVSPPAVSANFELSLVREGPRALVQVCINLASRSTSVATYLWDILYPEGLLALLDSCCVGGQNNANAELLCCFLYLLLERKQDEASVQLLRRSDTCETESGRFWHALLTAHSTGQLDGALEDNYCSDWIKRLVRLLFFSDKNGSQNGGDTLVHLLNIVNTHSHDADDARSYLLGLARMELSSLQRPSSLLQCNALGNMLVEGISLERIKELVQRKRSRDSGTQREFTAAFCGNSWLLPPAARMSFWKTFGEQLFVSALQLLQYSCELKLSGAASKKGDAAEIDRRPCLLIIFNLSTDFPPAAAAAVQCQQYLPAIATCGGIVGTEIGVEECAALAVRGLLSTRHPPLIAIIEKIMDKRLVATGSRSAMPTPHELRPPGG